MPIPAKKLWTCPNCGRSFRAKILAHHCGESQPERFFERARNEIAVLFFDLQKYMKSLGPVEVIFRPQYAIFRYERNFCWAILQTKRLRVSMILPSAKPSPVFSRIVPMSKTRVAQGAWIQSKAELRQVKPYLKMAYQACLKTPVKSKK